MKLLRWLQDSLFVRNKALRDYRRGMVRARRKDHGEALANYTAAIDAADVPPDVKAMALYNRALVHVATGNDAKGIDDLDAVLAMDGAMVIVNVKTMARQKLAKMESRNRKSDR
jgi:adenine C2-methylase RlmN of 23S rRNA A2503 and tRNA A37